MLALSELLARQEPAHAAFGRMLRNWRLRNGWTQYTACQWAEAAGFETISYGNLSVIEQAKAGELRNAAFFQLQEVNRRLSQRDYGTIPSPELREKVMAAQPITSPDELVWGAVEFWRCYIGDLPVPPTYREQPEPALTDKRARELSEQWRQQFKEAVRSAKADPLQALARMVVIAGPAGDRVRVVMSGFDDYSAAELRELRGLRVDGALPLADWIREALA